MQLNIDKKNRWQAELVTLSQKGDNCYPNLIEYILKLHYY